MCKLQTILLCTFENFENVSQIGQLHLISRQSVPSGETFPPFTGELSGRSVKRKRRRLGCRVTLALHTGVGWRSPRNKEMSIGFPFLRKAHTKRNANSEHLGPKHLQLGRRISASE
ncbi:hypothetical protein TNIN_362061 [Trichonephila inaurata madagascariensis]|uniref:Uncharacterized protein n=1 Tax=Trichonephila inaurata madagascariensis TaxID=2747483 RepID=A0A8X6XIG7_9ARAC|nr:hypothetical protein TNIN_362061 [Trichonephila inaurata madagascariensis]